MTPQEVIAEWGQIYRWDGGDSKKEAMEEAALLIDRLRQSGFEIVAAAIVNAETPTQDQ